MVDIKHRRSWLELKICSKRCWSIWENPATEMATTAPHGLSIGNPKTIVFVPGERFFHFGRPSRKTGSIRRQCEFINVKAIWNVLYVGCAAKVRADGRSKLEHTIRPWYGNG